MSGQLYPCNKEYEKIIKYNGNWYKLKSIFDQDNAEKERKFDFNDKLTDANREYQHYEIDDSPIFDFNAHTIKLND